MAHVRALDADRHCLIIIKAKRGGLTRAIDKEGL